MFTFKKIQLCKDTNGQLNKEVFAEINEGQLLISGVDSGPSVKSMLGDDEYKYHYSFDKENTQKIIDFLVGDNANADEEFEKRFSGLSGVKNLRDLCEEQGISFKFISFK